MIRGLRIPQQQLYNFSEEQLSTAFAYVAQLVDAISRLWDVRLRYRPVYRASRSYVWDDAISGSMFPLFWKSTERETVRDGRSAAQQGHRAAKDGGEGERRRVRAWWGWVGWEWVGRVSGCGVERGMARWRM